MIKTAQSNVTGPMDKAEAQAITDRIRKAVDGLWQLLLEAHDRRAWRALGHGSWEAYVNAEFGMTRQHSYRLLDQGRVIHAIEEAAGKVSPMGDISERDARDLKPVLPKVAAEIKQRVKAGEEPEKAVKEVVSAAREAKAAEKHEHIRQRDEMRAALPENVKAQQEAKAAAVAKAKAPKHDDDHDAILAEVEELREANASLEQEVARLKAENQKFAEMKALFDKGGFEEVIKAKDAVIAAQATRIERESGDKVAYMRSADAWRKRAEEAGWSDEVVFDIPGRVANG